MVDTATLEREEDHSPELKRVMGPRLLLLFIVGDILGTGVYALTGEVAGEVGGAAWAPFLVAFAVATDHRVLLPRARDEVPAGRRCRALHAQGVRHPLPDLHRRLHRDVLGHHVGVDRVAGLRREPRRGLHLTTGTAGWSLLALGFMLCSRLINFRGVGESVKANIVLTLRRALRPAARDRDRLLRLVRGSGDSVRCFFESPGDKSAFFAVTAARRSRSSRWSASRTRSTWPRRPRTRVRIFPKVMLSGLAITGIIYVLVSISLGRPGTGRRARPTSTRR